MNSPRAGHRCRNGVSVRAAARAAVLARISAIAATLAVVFGALFWNARSELTKPRLIADEQVLLPDGRRGGDDDGFVKLTADGDSFLLAASLINEPAFDNYRIEILDPSANPPTIVWSSKPAPRLPDDSVTILVSRTFFRPGKYKLVLYGVNGTREERLSTSRCGFRNGRAWGVGCGVWGVGAHVQRHVFSDTQLPTPHSPLPTPTPTNTPPPTPHSPKCHPHFVC